MLLWIGTLLNLWSGPLRAAPADSPWGADYFPNVPLVNQDGKTVRFYDNLIKDKVVAINFIYTHCTDTCPAETANLRQVEKLLGDRIGRDVHFYSISIDPRRDTPATLKEYARKFNAGPGWTFLTGKVEDINLLRKKLGLNRTPAEMKQLGQHSTSIMVGNERTGQWIKRSPFDESKVLAWVIGTYLSESKPSLKGQVSYASAGPLPKIGAGEDLYRSRCDSCHSLGKDDGVGPGLAGVTRSRDRAWLERWLKEPDAMIREKAPLAMALYNKYNRVTMPNLRLTDVDVRELIQFLSERDTASSASVSSQGSANVIAGSSGQP